MAEQVKRTTCSYCSVGCNLDITIREDETLSLKPNKEYPVNEGFCCVKGFHLLVPFQSSERGTAPLLRQKNGDYKTVDWDEAYQKFADGFKSIIAEHGPESVAFLSTGQMPMEEMALLGSAAKFGMGWIHGDGNTRQCMATAAVAYKQSFGFDAPPFCYEDFELSDLLIFIGANPVINHPIIWNHVKKNTRNPFIIVIDPRMTETAEQASLHLAVNPKSDLALLYGIARVLIEKEWLDNAFIEQHTEDFEIFRSHVMGIPLEEAGKKTGLGVDAIYSLAERIHQAKAPSFWWTMGVNQSHQATRTAQGIINLALMTGNIGKPGTGANSITGQANAMGSRLYSNTTSLLGGHSFTSENDRKKIAGILQIPVERIPDKNSLPYNKILEQVRDGFIKGLWIIATNPAHSWINKTEFFDSLKQLDFLVVQDLFPGTETAQCADLFLPAAGSAEKSGTFINSERRIGIVQKVKNPPGKAKSDFDIFLGIAEAWGCGDMFVKWSDPEAVFRILQQISRGQPCDISGIQGYKMIIDRLGIQWPYPQNAGAECDGLHRRLFADGRFYTPTGRAKFLFDDFAELPENTDSEYPLVLITGRGSVMQFHTQTRTGKVPFIQKKTHADCYVEINSEDAEALGLTTESRVRVTSRRGSVEVNAIISGSLCPGQVFMPMHYQETNWLTMPSFDPYSGEPAYKYAAVNLKAV
ncbi:MAG: nitrate reductase [Spirochaetales bacterium]|nr:nitrate reductase [Spirochaetales bacterium]